MTRSGSHFAAALLLTIAAGLCFSRWARHPTDVLVGPQRGGLNDVTSQILAFRGSQAKILSEGSQGMLWNPSSLAGMPWLGNPQTAMFYPPNWLYAFLASELAVSWIMVGHHWLAGFGTYLQCRRYGLAWFASVFAGICFLAAPYYVANTGEGHYNPVCLIAWVPWAFLFVERLRAGQRGGVIGTGLVLTLAFFCGHVQELFYLVLLLTAFLAVDVVRRLRLRGSAPGDPHATELGRGSAGRIALGWAAVGLVVVGLTAIELIPTWVYTRQSVRVSGLRLEDVGPMCLQPVSLLQLLDPLVTGGPERYWGPGQYYWEALCHFGVVCLAFAIVGVCLGWRRYPVIRFGVLWWAALLFALGDQTPWFPLLYRYLPGVSLFRAPARAMFFCSFFTAVLAGVGFDALLALADMGRFRCRRRALIALGLTVGAGVALWVWQQGGTAGSEAPAAPGSSLSWSAAWRSLAVSRVTLWVLAALAAVFLSTLDGRWRQFGAAFGLVLCVSELAWHGNLVLRTIPQESIRRENPILAAIQPRLGLQRVLVGQSLVSDREAWQAGIQKVQGYDPVPLARIGSYAAAVAPRQDAAMVFAGFHELNLHTARKPLLDLMGIRYAVVAGKPRREIPGWNVVQVGQTYAEFTLRGNRTRQLPYFVCENPSVLPRTFVLGQARPYDTSQDAVKLLAALDPRQTVLVERDVLSPGPRQAFRPAKLVDYSATKVTVEAVLDAPGYLVLTDVHYPGWTAAVDGRPAPVVPANIAFRAVALESGRHEVEFRYSPPGGKIGSCVSLLTMLILLIAAVGQRRRPSRCEGAGCSSSLRPTDSAGASPVADRNAG